MNAYLLLPFGKYSPFVLYRPCFFRICASPAGGRLPGETNYVPIIKTIKRGVDPGRPQPIPQAASTPNNLLLPASEVPMKAEHVNPFITATISVISTMAFVKPAPGKPFLKKDNKATGDVSAIVGMTGPSHATFSISFQKKAILAIVSGMFGEPIENLNDEVAEAAGELANMISGQARKELESVGLVYEGAIPSVASGENHELKHITDGPKIAVPFVVADSAFTLELSFEA
ncbi:chemotaxis protein CheX [Desulfobotulus sp. H1]|uniref:Chemotaxis protein CheX n=1 Tax=Desulfobotulus pelophilus TaxID=2823377 RepID=A0ABT3ND61_9BACT|nr:chemotaxis protein CheX [Desulfobotulus pelophilus]MCW7755388.1 chemotaxis protein CheX [Desulfobotulus pelophilus]